MTVNASAYPFPTNGTHYVYAKVGETIALASSAQSGTNTQIKLYNPSGIELSLTIGNNAGNIANRTAELEGPRLPGQTSPANAYTAIYHTVVQEGIYKVEFLPHGNGSGSGGRDNISGNGNWTQAANSVYIPAWDVSVANVAKTGWIKGRVYMNVLNMDIYTITSGFSNIGGFYGKFKILTKDGYVYNVDNNGNNGISFTFFVNNKGFFKSTTDNTPLYKSMDLSNLSGRVHDPRTADAGSEVTHKIFYTLPANDLPTSANGAVPGNSTWLKNNRIVPKVEQLKVIGVDGTNGQVSNKGGKISFETGNTGQYKIVIESNGGVNFPARTLTGIALAGVNNILWDGKDGAGNPLPQGNVPAKISVQLQGAEVHFPYLDMEINPNGIILELLNDNLSSVESNIVYWDDTDIPNTSSGTNSSPKNASHFVLPNGTPSSGTNANGHKWGANTTATSGTFGDVKAMDTWTFILGPVETLQTQIAVKVADLKIESVSTSNGVVKVGDEIVYTVIVKNDGPSDVQGAPFSFNAPTGYEITSATPKTVCTGGAQANPSITSNKFNSALDMPNGCSITYEIKVKPTSTAPFGPITVDATIMRPNDVTDPDATNPDINTPPTDPYFECGNGVAGAGCNNIKNNTTVTLIDLLTATKSIVGNPATIKPGQAITYQIKIKNSNTVAKTPVQVSDVIPAGLSQISAITNGGTYNPTNRTITWSNLTVAGNSELTLSFNAIVDANLAAGTVSIKNTAIVTDPIDPTVPVTPEVEVPTEGKITSVKSIVGNPTSVKSGDELEYRIVLTNSYGTAKSGVTVSDALAAELNAPTAISNGGSLSGNTINWTNLTVPANGTLTLSFKAVVKANLAAGTVSIKNTAIVTDPIDPTVPVTPEVEVPTEGKITSVKSIVGNPTKVKSGDELEYRIVLTNSYGTAKTGVTVSDALAAELNAPTAISNGGSLSGNTINWTNLTVPANGTLTLSFKAVVKANLPTGTTAIKNTAIVTDPIDPTVPVTPEVEVKVPSIALVKESVLNDENGDQIVQKGETVTYTFKVFNNGGTVVNNLVINDSKLNIVNLPVVPSLLNPGETGTVTATYTLTQADIDAGSITNTALAKGTDPRGRDVTDISGTAVDNNIPTVTVLPKQPSLVLHKTGTYIDKDNNGSTNVGDVIKYRFEVINNGNVTVKGITISDPKVTVTGGPVDLAPGSSDATTFYAEYIIKQEDIDKGGVYNLATAEGKDPDGDNVSVTSKDPNPISTDPGVDPGCLTCTITPLDRKGEITVMKTANLSQQFRYAGEKIEYDIVVTNTGNVTLKNVNVTDANADIKNIGTITELKVGQSETFKAYHTITAADMLQGYVSNIAVAVGNDPKNNPVTGESKSGNPTQPKDPVDPNCKTCTITPLPWKEIKANNDTPPAINGKDGGSTTSVLDNDQLNGKPVVPAEVKLTPGNSPNKGITMNPDGTITVSPETPSGNYEYPYTICEILNPANCSDAKATVVVQAAPIKANNDTPPAINGKDGGSTTSVLDNDQLNGKPVVPAEVKLTPGTSPNKGITMNPDGTITVSPETPSGNYEYPYTICEILNPANCSDAKVTVVVEAAPIKANNDTPPAINGKDGGSTTSVLDNDQLNGKPVVPAEVKLTPGTSPIKGITMNPDGTITVSPETPAGNYKYPYTICEILNPANCSDAKVTVVVEAAPIKANSDTPVPVNGKNGKTIPSVLDNDQLNGKPVVPAEVKLTPGTSPNKGITMNPDGTITVSPETPTGNYEYPYTICEVLNPTNCSNTVVRITVVEPKLEILKVADRSRVKAAGEEITYTITVKNTGGVEFNNLVLTDVMFPAWNEKIAVLAIGATRSFSLTHKVTQDEIENGVLVNTAKVNAQDPDGKPYQPEVKIETPVDNLAGLTVVKTGDRKEVKERGDKIVYTITVENTGNKILYDIEVTDPLTKLSKTITQLAPGQKEVFTTEYVVIQSDFDLAEIENTAFVKAKDGKGNVVDASGQYSVTVSPLPLHIPNVFTPNGDGQNDKFEIEGIERFDRVEMTIINRWGNEVYRNSRYDNNWVGEGLNEGTYYYIIETHKGSTKQLHKGWVLIKRN
ncbi:conserved repeat protein [Sphingobacterium spiritivorum ATCC 33861]|uniref:Conserved repeat protein n=2 Tax=Sphingobacterium spiritivorum TaxID=258 RepID=D7VPY5_SPHSI|nr:conserved repeat protein [Sphingobacterium spiritivorum ATCC 33861]